MDLPYLTAELPGCGGALRTRDDDFVVDEEPAYAPAGSGDHVFVRIEKRGLGTPEAVQRIARALGVAARDIGVAGMKDRHAVTRQWLSLPPPVTPEAASALALDDIAILEAARHPHKLRTGHLRANRFRLIVRGGDAARARAILDALARPPGMPNWYGEQRFGKDGDNAQRGLEIIRGAQDGAGPASPDRRGRPPRDRKLARLLVSALQSQLFNDWLRARMRDGLYAHVVAGDILHKRGGGQFVCEDVTTDQARLANGELVITGPMFGDRMRRPPDGSDAAAREDAILAAAGIARDAIPEGTRRDATIEVASPSVTEIADASIQVCFALPSGAYATAVMRELMKVSG